MTTYVFTLSDKTPAAEIDVKETVIAQGAGQDLYDRAKKELGYTGTFGEFLATFKGEQGLDGATGATGATGADGKNVEADVKGNGNGTHTVTIKDGNGNTTTAIIKDGATGAKGDTGATGANAKADVKDNKDGTHTVTITDGNGNTTTAIIKDGATGAKGDTGDPGRKGSDGKSAYEIAVANGFVGDEAQWLESLKGRDGSPGKDGKNGKSAFEIAGGDVWFGSEEGWLNSLKGAKGDTGLPGKSATVTIGTVTTGETASVTNTGTETAAVLNFVLPAGGGSATPAGQANEYGIHGQGMPNGQVAAPVGTTYVDTNATNGALKWIKRTGTDNQGWEVLTGDTGWRTLTIASKLGASYLKVRRKNDTVMYQFGGLSWGWFGIVRRGGPGYSVQPSDRERNVFILGLRGIPEGFRSEFSLIGGIYNDKGTPYGTWYLGGSGDAYMLRFQFTDPVPTDRDIGDIRVSPIMYLTDDPWPTRLP